MTTPPTSPATSSSSSDPRAAVSGGLPTLGTAVHPTVMAQAQALTAALAHFADQMARMEYGAEHLSCSETEAIVDVLVLSGHAEEGAKLRELHTYGDDDSGDEHHEEFHRLHDHDRERIRECCGYDGNDN